MQKDPAYRSDILEPIEIMGVDRFEDPAVIVRARLRTDPMQQWRVRREFNRRMKKLFDEGGIEIPFPHRALHRGQMQEGSEPPARMKAEGPLVGLEPRREEQSLTAGESVAPSKGQAPVLAPGGVPPGERIEWR